MNAARFPRLLNSDLSEARRIQPVDGSLNLTIVPLSTASLAVLTAEAAPIGSWVEMYSPNGSAGIYRVSTVDNGHGTELTSMELEHAVAEVGNYVVNGEVSEELPLNEAINRLWGYYKGSRWRIGSNSFTDRVLVDALYDNLLQALLDLLEQTAGYMMAFDFSTNPWTINIVRKDTAVSAEGRLSRNVEEAHVTYDLTELCTRVYVDYDADDSAGGAVSMDADTISQYGVIEKHVPGSGYTYSQAQAVAREYLEKHKRPQIGATITGVDFASVTGEPLDTLAIGKLYRLAVPKHNVVIEQHITGLSWSHLYTDPSAVEIALGVEEDRVVSYMQQTTETVSKGGKGTIKKQGRYWTKFDRTDHYIDQVAAYTDENGNVLKQAGMYIDANGVLQYAQDNEKQIGSQFKVAADQISAEVTQRKNGERILFSTIEQTATQIRSEVVDVKKGLESSITQTAREIRAEVSDTAEGLQASIDVQRDRIGLVVEGTGANAKIRPAQIVASINNATKESSVLISADRISLSGQTTVQDSMTIENGSLKVKKNMLIGSSTTNAVSINDGKVNAPQLQVNSGGKLTIVGASSGEHYDIDASTIATMIKSASVSGNVLTLTPFAGSDITFSKATTLSGGWSSGVYHVTAKQNGTAVATHNYDPPMRLNGTTAASNFSAEIYEVTGSSTTYRKRIYGYLVSTANGASSYVDVNTKSDGTGTSVARLSVGSIYTGGRTDGWNQARGKVRVPGSGSAASITANWPGANYNTQESRIYELATDGNNAVILRYNTAPSGQQPQYTTAARITHNGYDNGYTAGDSAGYERGYKVTDGDISISVDSDAHTSRGDRVEIWSSRPGFANQSWYYFDVTVHGHTKQYAIYMKRA